MATETTPPHLRPQDIAVVAPNVAPPPGNPRFPLFDALRAIAALAVFLGHTVTGTTTFGRHPDLFLGAEQLAYQGVAIFFLISGFLLYRPFLAARRGGSRIAVRDYAQRRVLRIVPAYWVALSIFIAAGFVSGVSAHNWWVFYGFGQTYSSTTISNGLGVAWTLCIEVTFYALLPLFAVIASRLGRGPRSVRGDVVMLIVLSAGSLAFRTHFHTFADFATVSTLPGTFLWFALGMALAILSVTHERRGVGNGRVGDGLAGSGLIDRVARHPGVMWVVALVASALLYELIHSTQTVGAQLGSHVLYGVVALLILLPGVFEGERQSYVHRVLNLRSLAWIGLVSYGFYLYHSVVIAQLTTLARDNHLPARYVFVLVASFVVTVVCSAASYYLLERPIMRRSVPTFAGRRARRHEPAGPVPTEPQPVASSEGH